MKKCRSCGKLVNEQLNFCPDCGEELPTLSSEPEAPPGESPIAPGPDGDLLPDHVTMGEYAGFWIRFAAIFIDGLVAGLIQLPAAAIIYALQSSDPEAAMAGASVISNLLSIVVWCGNNIYLQSTYGWTIGKKICGLVVLTADGEFMSIGRTLGRELFKAWISGPVCLLGFIMAAFDADKQGWHDKIAGTYVYYD